MRDKFRYTFKRKVIILFALKAVDKCKQVVVQIEHLNAGESK